MLKPGDVVDFDGSKAEVLETDFAPFDYSALDRIVLVDRKGRLRVGVISPYTQMLMRSYLDQR